MNVNNSVNIFKQEKMTDCVDGEVMLGGHQGPSSQPALQMEDLRLEEKLDRTLLNNTGY